MPSPTELARDALAKVGLLEKDVVRLQEEAERLDQLQLRERIAVLEDRVNELKRLSEERDKRRWQFLHIGFGAVLAVIGGISIQLVVYFLKS